MSPAVDSLALVNVKKLSFDMDRPPEMNLPRGFL